MKTCPNCGYDPDPVQVSLSDKELRKQQIQNHFKKNAQQYWWISQTEDVCNWLRNAYGLNPKKILDVGCGDGRWAQTIYNTWPDIDYTGVDRLQDHILNNREFMPYFNWILGDIEHAALDKTYDTIFIMGTLNPLKPKEEQDGFFKKINELSPDHIVCLFDKKQTGYPPHEWISGKNGKYIIYDSYFVPDGEKAENQDLVVWVYERV